MGINNSKLLSGAAPVVAYDQLTGNRYEFLTLGQAEPSLGAGAANSILTLGVGNTRVWSNSISVTSINSTGNISAAYFFGNGSQLTGIDATSIQNGNSNVRVAANANVTVGISGVSNVAVFTVDGISVTGNITGNYYFGNGRYLTGITAESVNAANLTGNTLSSNVLFSSLTTVGNLTGLSVIGNASVGNLSTTGTISAVGNVTGANINTTTVWSSSDLYLNPTGNVILGGGKYINSVNNPVQDQDAATKYYVDTMVSTGLAYHQAVVAATTSDLATATGGTITYTQPNGASNGVGAYISTTGTFDLIDTANVQTANTRILVKDEGNAVLNGVYYWANATTIVRTADADEYGPNSAEQLSVNDYFFVTSGNVNKGSAWVVDAPTGTITFGTSNISFAQFSSSQTYTANANAGLTLTGTVFSAKVDNNTTTFDGGGNIAVKAGANLVTPNIGAATGTSLSVSGNVVGGNIVTVGSITATGNVTGNYFIGNGSQLTGVTATNVDAGNLTGNTLSANVIFSSLTTLGTLTSLTVSGNVTGANLFTSGQVSATGNISSGANISGNFVAPGANREMLFNDNGLINSNAGLTFDKAGPTLSLTNAAGTVITGFVSSLGGNDLAITPATSNLVIWANTNPRFSNTYQLGTSTFQWKNVWAGNANIGTLGAGTLSTSGNITSGANVLVSGNVSATGNVTGGNILFGSGIVSGTGNIYANKIFANISGNIDAAGNLYEIQFNTTGDQLGANANFTYDSANNVFTVANGNIVGGNIAVNNVIVGNILIPSSGNVTLGNVNINNLANPVANSDAATKFYVDSVAGNLLPIISNQTISPDGSSSTFNLNQSTTAVGVLVTINGVTQTPDVSYTVASNSISFSQTPLTGDIIQVRYLSGTTTGGGGITKTKLLNHVALSGTFSGPVNVSTWSANYAAGGGAVEVTAQITAFATATGLRTFELQRNGNTVDTATFFFNQTSVHMVLPTLCWIANAETGTNTYSIRIGNGMTVDIQDSCLMVITEY